jgi:hypothetical protein
MQHLNIDSDDFLDALCDKSDSTTESFEDLLSTLEDGLESGELTITEVQNILEQYS